MTVHDKLIQDWLAQLAREIATARDALAPREEIDLLLHIEAMLRGFRGAVHAAERRSPTG